MGIPGRQTFPPTAGMRCLKVWPAIWRQVTPTRRRIFLCVILLAGLRRLSRARPITGAISYNHASSADGKFIAYEDSPAFGAGGNAAAGIILRYSVDTGLTDAVHTNAAVAAGPKEDIRSLDLTPDGRFIAFIANTNGTQGATTCVLVWDAQTGITSLASGSLSTTVPANSTCDWPAIDPSGRWIAFLSTATNLTTNTLKGSYHLYVRDMQANATVLADADANGIGAGVTAEAAPRLSADGRFVAFEGLDSSLVPNDRNRRYDVVLR